MTRHLPALAILDADAQTIRDAVVTYRALGLAALDSLAEATALNAKLTRQLAETRAELRRISAEACRT